MTKSKFHRRFSFGHADDNSDNTNYANVIMRSDPEFQDEVSDIYFGRAFNYVYNGVQRTWGNVMGRIASDVQVRALLDMQEKTGIYASLTFNEMQFYPEIVGDRVIRNAFVQYVKSFYDAGIRMCTISDIHLMSTGVLQEAMPDMHWKNTVNHIVRTPQEVVDYARLGFQTILVDRSLNRDLEELKRVKKVADQLGVKVSLLTRESCMPSCPFKREHDLAQPYLQNGFNPTANPDLKTYWGVFGDLSCNRWRNKNMEQIDDTSVADHNALMPRVGTDIVALDKATLDEYLDNTHIFKHSGRLLGQHDLGEAKMYWIDTSRQQAFSRELRKEGDVLARSFQELYDRDAAPFHMWSLYMQEGDIGEQNWAARAELNKDSVWMSKKAKALAHTLKNCRNQCYDCHACERVFGYKDFDSLLDVKSTKGWTDKADRTIPIHPFKE